MILSSVTVLNCQFKYLELDITGGSTRGTRIENTDKNPSGNIVAHDNRFAHFCGDNVHELLIKHEAFSYCVFYEVHALLHVLHSKHTPKRIQCRCNLALHPCILRSYHIRSRFIMEAGVVFICVFCHRRRDSQCHGLLLPWNRNWEQN